MYRTRFEYVPSFAPALPFGDAILTVDPVFCAQRHKTLPSGTLNASPLSVTSIASETLSESAIFVISLFWHTDPLQTAFPTLTVIPTLNLDSCFFARMIAFVDSAACNAVTSCGAPKPEHPLRKFAFALMISARSEIISHAHTSISCQLLPLVFTLFRYAVQLVFTVGNCPAAEIYFPSVVTVPRKIGK